MKLFGIHFFGGSSSRSIGSTPPLSTKAPMPTVRPESVRMTFGGQPMPTALRVSTATSIPPRTPVLRIAKQPFARASSAPARGPASRPAVQPSPRHSLGSQVWSQWTESNKALGEPWKGSLNRHDTHQLEGRLAALEAAVGAQLQAIKANNAVPGASVFGKDEMQRQLSQRLDEAEHIKRTLTQRKAPSVPLGVEVWNSARIAQVQPATRPLHQMSNTELNQRRDALALAINAHAMSSHWFTKAHGQREFGREILDLDIERYRAVVHQIDALQARRAGRR